MERSFDAQSLVVLPRLTASDAVALGTELSTAAKGKKLPTPLSGALKKVVGATGVLEKVLAAKDQPLASGNEARAADQAEDNAWAALSEFLASHLRLPDRMPETKKAREVIAQLFGDGLKFTQLTFK